MTVRTYLSQAYRLENRIKLIKERIEDLRELATSVSSPGFEEHYNATKNTDAPFIRVLEKIMDYEEEYQNQLYQLLSLQKQIDDTIATVEEVDLRMVLTYRYIKCLSWYKIGSELCIDESTARRWHDKALTKVVVPEDAIEI